MSYSPDPPSPGEGTSPTQTKDPQDFKFSSPVPIGGHSYIQPLIRRRLPEILVSKDITGDMTLGSIP